MRDRENAIDSGREAGVSTGRLDKSRNGKFLLDLGVLASGQVVSRIIGFAAFAYLARILSPAGYGAVEYLVGLAVIFTMIVDAGQSVVGVRRLTRSPENTAMLAAQIPLVRFLMALIAAPAMAYIVLHWGAEDAPPVLIILFAASLFFAAGKQEWLMQAKGLMTEAALAQAIRMAAFAFALVIMVRSPDQIINVGAAEILAVAAATVYYYWVQINKITPVSFIAPCKDMISLAREGAPVAASQLVWSLNQYMPLFFVGGILAATELAWFGATLRLVLAIVTFAFIYHFNLYPTVAKRAKEDPESLPALLESSFVVTAWLSIGSALFLTLSAAQVMALLFGPLFSEAGSILAILIWNAPVVFLYGHPRCTVIAAGKQTRVMWSQIAGAAVIMTFTVPAITQLGGEGAALAMVAAAVIVWLVLHISALRAGAISPSLAMAVKPALMAAICGLPAYYYFGASWVAAFIGASAYFASMLIIEPRVRADIVRLAVAREQGV